MDRTLSQISRDFSLTNREVNVLSLLLRGYSNDQISSTLFVSIPTVKKHLASIYSKMEIKSQKQILERLHFYDKSFSHESCLPTNKGSPLILQTPFFVPLFTLAFLLALPGFLFFRS